MFSNSTFTNGGIGIYSYDSSIDATGNTLVGHSNYNVFSGQHQWIIELIFQQHIWHRFHWSQYRFPSEHLL